MTHTGCQCVCLGMQETIRIGAGSNWKICLSAHLLCWLVCFPKKHQSRIATFQFKSNVKVSWRALHLLFHLKKPSPAPSDVPGAFSPSGLCGQCSLCGSSGQQRQSVRTEEDEAEFRVAAVLQVSPSETCSSIFIPVEIWLWLQPPSSSHETRGSRTLHLWD